MAKKISIINFKGGVGKSTLTFHLAAHLAKTSRVLVVDVDHQSSLSIVMMGADLWQSAVNGRTTCNSIFESFWNRRVAMPGAEIIHKNISTLGSLIIIFIPIWIWFLLSLSWTILKSRWRQLQWDRQ